MHLYLKSCFFEKQVDKNKERQRRFVYIFCRLENMILFFFSRKFALKKTYNLDDTSLNYGKLKYFSDSPIMKTILEIM